MRRRSSAAATAPATSSTDAMAPMPTSPHASRLLTGEITVTADAAAVDDVLVAAAAAAAAATSTLELHAAAAVASSAALVLVLYQAGEAGDGPAAAAAAAVATTSAAAAVGEELLPTFTAPPATEEPNAPASAFTAPEGCPSEVSRSSCRAVSGLSHIRVFMAGAT